MRRLSSALALISVTALLAACTSSTSAEAGWTYAPAPSVTPGPSGEPSGSPAASVEPSEAPTATPEESESAEPSESGEPSESAAASGGPELIITAPVGSAVSGFDPNELEAPADVPFKITFDNEDTGVPHNFVLNNPDGTPVDIGDTAFFNGPERRTYDVPALAAGEYPFMCQVHPTTMTGTLTAG